MEITMRIGRGYGRRVKTDWLKKLAEKVLAAEKVGQAAEVSIFITGQEQIHKLNRQFLEEDRPTDVLSFPMLEGRGSWEFVNAPDKALHLGEVIISYPQAQIQAAEHGHNVETEMAVLIVHGLLHLLGYDHDIASRTRRMRAREKAVLRGLQGAGL
jgi:probable rRNA maturation factor